MCIREPGYRPSIDAIIGFGVLMDHHYQGVWLGLVLVQGLLVFSAFRVTRTAQPGSQAISAHVDPTQVTCWCNAWSPRREPCVWCAGRGYLAALDGFHQYRDQMVLSPVAKGGAAVAERLGQS